MSFLWGSDSLGKIASQNVKQWRIAKATYLGLVKTNAQEQITKFIKEVSAEGELYFAVNVQELVYTEVANPRKIKLEREDFGEVADYIFEWLDSEPDLEFKKPNRVTFKINWADPELDHSSEEDGSPATEESSDAEPLSREKLTKKVEKIEAEKITKRRRGRGRGRGKN